MSQQSVSMVSSNSDTALERENSPERNALNTPSADSVRMSTEGDKPRDVQENPNTKEPQTTTTHMHLDESTWGDTLKEWKATHQQQHQNEFETLLTRTAIPTDQDSNSTSSPYPSSPDPPASTAQRLKRLRKELALVADNPHMTFFQSQPQPQPQPPIPVSTPPSSQPSSLLATLEGPPHSPYAHGIFHIAITLPPTWPANPPKLRFLTPIYHPDIDQAGIVHVEFLGGDWCPALTLEKVLYMLCAILSDAWPGEGGKERGRFEGEARKWTGRFAGVERGAGLDLDGDRLEGDGDGDGERG